MHNLAYERVVLRRMDFNIPYLNKCVALLYEEVGRDVYVAVSNLMINANKDFFTIYLYALPVLLKIPRQQLTRFQNMLGTLAQMGL